MKDIYILSEGEYTVKLTKKGKYHIMYGGITDNDTPKDHYKVSIDCKWGDPILVPNEFIKGGEHWTVPPNISYDRLCKRCYG